MDIRDWPIDRIMQLPDCCFGRRWPVSVCFKPTEEGTYYDISEAALPEKCVVWSLFAQTVASGLKFGEMALSLGDVLPVTDAQFDAFERLFSDLGYLAAGRRTWGINDRGEGFQLSLRQPVITAGRRLVGRCDFNGVSATPLVTGVVISSVPTEVPDWLCSGRV